MGSFAPGFPYDITQFISAYDDLEFRQMGLSLTHSQLYPSLNMEQNIEELLGRFFAMNEWMNEWIYLKILYACKSLKKSNY